MGCCETAERKPRMDEQVMLANINLQNHFAKNKVINCSDEREITIDNRSNIVLWVIVDWQQTRRVAHKSLSSMAQSRSYSGKIGVPSLVDAEITVSSTIQENDSKENLIEYDTEHQKTPSANKVPIWSKESYNGFKHTFITAWFHKVDDKVIVWDNKCISLNEDIFIFDGQYLRRSDFNDPYNDVVNMRNGKTPYLYGSVYVMPCMFTKERALQQCNGNINIESMRHTRLQRFILSTIRDGYCQFHSESGSLWTVNNQTNLCLCKLNRSKSFKSHFKIETIAGSDITVKIKCRADGLYLTVNDKGSGIRTARWSQDDAKQRFFLQIFDS